MRVLFHYFSTPLLMGVMLFSSTATAQPFVGLSVGQSTLDDFCDGIPFGVSCDDTDSALKLFGGYRFNQNMAFEAAYIDMGESVATDGFDTLKAEATALNFSVLGIIPVSSTFEIFGKFGLAFWDTKLSASGSFSGARDADGQDIMFGAGVSFQATNQLSIRAEAEKFDNVGDGTATLESSVTILSVGGVVSF